MLIPINTKNCWFFHDWGKWRQYSQNYIGTFAFGKKKGENYQFSETRQQRICARCGKMEDVKIY